MPVVHETFAGALEEIGAEDADHARQLGFTVCGVYLDENTPRCFVMELDPDTGEPVSDPGDVAFEIKHGRPMDDYERWALSMARAMRSPDGA